jgi:hypothetical protein
MTDRPSTPATPDADTLVDGMLAVPTDVRVYRQLLEHLEGDDYIRTPVDIAVPASTIDWATASPFGSRVPDGSCRDLCGYALALGSAFTAALLAAVDRDVAIRAVQRAYAAEIGRAEARRDAITAHIADLRQWLLDRYDMEEAPRSNEERMRLGYGPLDDKAMIAMRPGYRQLRAVADGTDGGER